MSVLILDAGIIINVSNKELTKNITKKTLCSKVVKCITEDCYRLTTFQSVGGEHDAYM